MMTPDAGLKSMPSTSKPSEEDTQPHDDEQEIKRSPSVLYLGLCIDEKLTWSEHNDKLFLQLAKYSAMLY